MVMLVTVCYSCDHFQVRKKHPIIYTGGKL